jgi:hypothetical protein
MSAEADWYYVGQYGELGPLTEEQMKDLVQDKVIEKDTYVWRRGMGDWVHTEMIAEFRVLLAPKKEPPPAPSSSPRPPVPQQSRPAPQPSPVAPVTPQAPPAASPYGQPVQQPAAPPYGQQQPPSNYPAQANWSAVEASLPRSDKSRVTAGVLNLFLPGVGRFYLGYAAHGALQFITCFCGIGFLWAWIDALYILMGGLKYDGYGRLMKD